MKKLGWRLRTAVRRWLGLGELFMGVDVSGSQMDESSIVIVSRLGNGAVRIIDSRFGSMVEIENLVKELQNRYGIDYQKVYKDTPMGLRVR